MDINDQSWRIAASDFCKHNPVDLRLHVARFLRHQMPPFPKCSQGSYGGAQQGSKDGHIFRECEGNKQQEVGVVLYPRHYLSTNHRHNLVSAKEDNFLSVLVPHGVGQKVAEGGIVILHAAHCQVEKHTDLYRQHSDTECHQQQLPIAQYVTSRISLFGRGKVIRKT